MDKEKEKDAKLKKIKEISFEGGRLVPATEIKSRAQMYRQGKLEPKPEPKPTGRRKGYRHKCKRCGQEGHMAKTCKKKIDDAKLPGWLVDKK